MRKKLSTIQQRILQKIELDTILKTLLVSTLLVSIPWTMSPSFHQVCPIVPYISIHLVESLQVYFYLITFFPYDLEYL